MCCVAGNTIGDSSEGDDELEGLFTSEEILREMGFTSSLIERTMRDGKMEMQTKSVSSGNLFLDHRH